METRSNTAQSTSTPISYETQSWVGGRVYAGPLHPRCTPFLTTMCLSILQRAQPKPPMELGRAPGNVFLPSVYAWGKFSKLESTGGNIPRFIELFNNLNRCAGCIKNPVYIVGGGIKLRVIKVRYWVICRISMCIYVCIHAQSQAPWWKGRRDSCKVSSDLNTHTRTHARPHTYTIRYTHTHVHIHTK